MTREELEALADLIVARLNLPTKDELLEAVTHHMPHRSDITEAVKRGVIDAMPYSSEITDAIYSATRQALEKHKP